MKGEVKPDLFAIVTVLTFEENLHICAHFKVGNKVCSKIGYRLSMSSRIFLRQVLNFIFIIAKPLSPCLGSQWIDFEMFIETKVQCHKLLGS